MPPLEGNSGISLEKTCKNRPPLPKKTTTAEKKLDNKTSSPSLEPSFERSDSVKRGLFQRLGTSSSSKCAVDESPMKKEGFQRSLSWNRNSSKSLTKKPLPADNDLQLVEEDPVVALFEARNTQRVRFSLEGKQPTRDSIATVQPIKEKQDPTFNIKTFMSKALFKSGSSFTLRVEPLKAEMKKSSINGGLVWESADIEHGPEVVHTHGSSALKLSYAEDPKTRNVVLKCLGKGRRGQFTHFQYQYAVKAYVKALNLLVEAQYPDHHPLMVRTRKLLSNAHHMLSSYKNSASIVKMGVKYEETGDLVRALKMYTIAYRMRRDQLSKSHPSLVVLLNILGSIQIKRREFKEAMQIFELALKEEPVSKCSDDTSLEEEFPSPNNLLARAVTYRDMGTIHEHWENTEKALLMYLRSLDCTSDWKDVTFNKKLPRSSFEAGKAEEALLESLGGPKKLPTDKSRCNPAQLEESVEISENGKIVIHTGSLAINIVTSGETVVSKHYNSFFPGAHKKLLKRSKAASIPTRKDYADVDIAMTLHQIAQMHRRQGQYGQSLDAFNAAFRGMRHALGDMHPNVAAILGNIGNLQKEYGDFDAAYSTYQEVLGIESHRLGVSHPEVAISLHNVATIEAARGNYENALGIYKKVLYLQKKHLGENHVSVSVTSACMGDVHERTGDIIAAIRCYEEAMNVKSTSIGRHNLDVARVLHKLGKLSFQRKELNLADSYIARAILIYRLNRLGDDHEWVFDAHRDSADIDAAMAFGSEFFLDDFAED